MKFILLFSSTPYQCSFWKTESFSVFCLYGLKIQVYQFPSLSFNRKFTALAAVPSRVWYKYFCMLKEHPKCWNHKPFNPFKQQKIVLNLASASEGLEFLILQKKLPKLAYRQLMPEASHALDVTVCRIAASQGMECQTCMFFWAVLSL